MSHVSIEQRVDRLHAGGVIDMHFDLSMDLYEKRGRSNVLATEFWGLELVHQVHHEAVPQIFEDMEMEVVSVGVHQSGQRADTGQNGIPLQRNAAFCSAAEQPFQSVAGGGQP